MADQSYGSHRRFIPLWHFFAFPILTANVVVEAVRFFRDPRPITAWAAIVALALIIAVFISRTMPLTAQDRVIRLEERTRLERLLPADLKGRVNDLTTEQLIAIRFAPDEEIPDLVRRCLNGELTTRSDIKRAIKNWRADHLRV